LPDNWYGRTRAKTYPPIAVRAWGFRSCTRWFASMAVALRCCKSPTEQSCKSGWAH